MHPCYLANEGRYLEHAYFFNLSAVYNQLCYAISKLGKKLPYQAMPLNLHAHKSTKNRNNQEKKEYHKFKISDGLCGECITAGAQNPMTAVVLRLS